MTVASVFQVVPSAGFTGTVADITVNMSGTGVITGKAVTGTHEELLKTVPEYENLYTSQVHTTENGGAKHDAQKTSENGDL